MTSKKRPAPKSKNSASSSTSQSASSNDPSVVAFKNFTADNLGNFGKMGGFTGQSKDQYEKMTSDAAETSRQSWDAAMQSGNMFKQGFEQWVQACTSIAQESAARSTEACKELMACKTLTEMTETQNRIAQESFSDCIQNLTKLSEIGIKIATETFEPISNQMNATIKKAG